MNGSVHGGAGLVWRHQRLVWWIFVVNLVLAWLASLPARATLSAVLDHSLESAKLVAGFDLGTLALMLERPDVQMNRQAPAMIGASVIFVMYLLLIDGGVFTVYLEDRKLSRAEFFENAGLYFWRMVRLALYSLIPFGLLAALHSSINNAADKLARDAAPERLGFCVQVGGGLLIALIALLVRLWFDLTQAQVVRDNERKVFRTLLRSIKPAFTSGLYWKYVGIGLLSAMAMAAGIGVWFYLPHPAMAASFVVLELMTVTMIATRLWLKATSARWAALQPAQMGAVAVVPVMETHEAEVAAPIVEHHEPVLEVTDTAATPPETEPPLPE
jgi:hypothetical protein